MFLTTEEDVCMYALKHVCGIKSIVFKIKIRSYCIQETLRIFSMDKS